MKTSFISSNAVSQAMRYQLMRMQAELAEKQQEVVTGKVADPGVKLGAGVSRTVSMNRDIDRLKGLMDSNGLASNRLAATQDALDQMTSRGQDLLDTLTASASGSVDKDVTQAAAARALDSLTGILNTNLNGEYLFAGINTDVKPINDYSDGSVAKNAFNDAFEDKFNFPPSDPAVADIQGDDIKDFLDNYLAQEFQGTNWSTNWSKASDEAITSRITLNETADTSVTANNDGAKKLLMAATAVSDLLKLPLGENARNALVTRATEIVGEGVQNVAELQGRTGIAENRVSDATDRISSQVDVFTTFINDLEGVDPYEASTKVSDLLNQIETSYALTSRIQQLSLVRYLS